MGTFLLWKVPRRRLDKKTKCLRLAWKRLKLTKTPPQANPNLSRQQLLQILPGIAALTGRNLLWGARTDNGAAAVALPNPAGRVGDPFF